MFLAGGWIECEQLLAHIDSRVNIYVSFCKELWEESWITIHKLLSKLYKIRNMRISFIIATLMVLLPSTLAWGFEWGINSHNVRTYVRLCHKRECQFVHVTELIRYRTHTSRALTRTGLGMHSLAASDGGQGRTVLLDNTGQVGQCGWSSAAYAFCRVEYRTQPTVCGIKKEKSWYSRS